VEVVVSEQENLTNWSDLRAEEPRNEAVEEKGEDTSDADIPYS
jgi:hypothetical protein